MSLRETGRHGSAQMANCRPITKATSAPKARSASKEATLTMEL